MKEFRRREIAFNFIQLDHNSTKMAKAMKRYNKEATITTMMDELRDRSSHEVDRLFVEETTCAMKSTHMVSRAKRSMKSKGIDYSSIIMSRKADPRSAPVKA